MPRVTAKGNVLPVEGSLKRITPRNQTLIDAVVSAKAPTYDALASITGLSAVGVRKALAKPHIQEAIEQALKQKLRTVTLPKAVAVADRLLNAESEYVQADVAKHVMAIHGVRPAGDSTTRTSAGIQINIIAPDREADSAPPPITIDVKSDDTQSNQ